jgi:hypothetical protein
LTEKRPTYNGPFRLLAPRVALHPHCGTPDWDLELNHGGDGDHGDGSETFTTVKLRASATATKYFRCRSSISLHCLSGTAALEHRHNSEAWRVGFRRYEGIVPISRYAEGMKPSSRGASASCQGAQGRSTTCVTTDSRAIFQMPLALKLPRKGSKPTTNPYELLAAAHAGCFSVALANELGDSTSSRRKSTAHSPM